MPYLCWDGHSTHVMCLVSKLYMNLELTDCTLETNGGLLHGHKTILVACSPYLKELIMDHTGMKVIPLKKVKYDIMKLILDFVYFGKVDVSVADVSSLIETARLLQIATLSDFSLTFPEKLSSNRSCDGNMYNNGTKCTVNQTKCNYNDLSVLDMKVICNQDINHEIEHRLTTACENIDPLSKHGSELSIGNGLKDLSQTSNNVLSKTNVQNHSVAKVDINEGTEKFQDNLSPFTFVAVSPFSVKSEHDDDELTASCGTPSEVENPLWDNRVNCDTSKEIKREMDFQPQSEVKKEIKEECHVHESDDGYEAMEMNCCFAERTEDLQVDFESVSDIPKCELSEVKPFETDRDNETMDGTNDPLTSNEVPESSKCEEEIIPLINLKGDENRASDGPNTKRLEIRELSIVLRRINSSSKLKGVDNQSGFEGSCKLPRTLSQRIKENMLDKSLAQDIDGSQGFSGNSQMDHLERDTLSMHLTEKLEKVNHSQKDEVRQNCNNSELKLFPCKFCEKSFKGCNMLKKHMLIHADGKLFLCDICNSSFRRNWELMIHLRSHSPCKCDICGKTFSTHGGLYKHTGSHTQEKPYGCDVCGNKFSHKNSLIQHMRTHTGEKPFKCDICGASFSQSATLATHTRYHTGEKPFKCDNCGTSFHTRCAQNRHRRTHTGEKPFKCDICGASFSKKYVLKDHLRIHTGEKPFNCDICGATFSLKHYLLQHIRTHTGEKPFKCDICGASFAQNGTLKAHVRFHSGEKLFKCEFCGARFLANTDLRRHQRTHTREKPYNCDTCGVEFSTYGGLKRHMPTHAGAN